MAENRKGTPEWCDEPHEFTASNGVRFVMPTRQATLVGVMGVGSKHDINRIVAATAEMVEHCSTEVLPHLPDWPGWSAITWKVIFVGGV